MEQVRDRNKGQLLLIGGFLVATVIIGVAVTVNGLDFTQSRSLESGVDETEPIRVLETTEEALMKAMSGTGGTPSDAKDSYENYTESYEASVRNASINDGAVFSLFSGTPESAWSVGQRKNSTFTNATGENDWVLVEDVSSVYSLRFNVSMSSVATNDYRMNVSTTDTSITPTGSISGGWYMEVSKSGGDLEIDGTGYGSGTAPASLSPPKTVTPEDGYAEFEISTGADAIRYENADTVGGKYDLRFDDTTDVSGPCSSAPCKGGDSLSKYAVGVVRKAQDVTVRYTDRNLRYNQTIDSLKLGFGEANLNTTDVYGTDYLNVRITSNNSPVNAGNPINIGYEVENTGDEDSTGESVELLVRSNGTSTVEDSENVDPDAGVSQTGILSWNTDPDDSGAYTVLVKTPDATDVVRVSVGDVSSGIDPGPVGMFTAGRQR
jgi:hypothetical protein